MKEFECSVGVICYNEEANIGRLLSALVNQELQRVSIREIIVVSSACTDKTDEIVLKFIEEFNLDSRSGSGMTDLDSRSGSGMTDLDSRSESGMTEKDTGVESGMTDLAVKPRISLIRQKTRQGKSSAINLFLKEATASILIVESGDTIPRKDAIEKLVSAFRDNRVGAVGGRPVPVNSRDTLMGFAVHLLWKLHHRMALINPKLGELIAFRRLMDQIAVQSAVDEATIEAIIKRMGLILKYIPDAIINNKGPENLPDFIKQRRRIQSGHLWLKRTAGYAVASQDGGLLLKILLQEILEKPSDVLKILFVIILEVYSRLLGSWDFLVLKKNPYVWDISLSTKKLG